MRKMVILIVLFISADAMAVYKCERDGKISYQQGPCVQGKELSIGNTTVSTLGSESIRRDGARRELQKIEQENLELRMLAQKSNAKGRQARAILGERGKWSEGDQIESQLRDLQRDIQIGNAQVQSMRARQPIRQIPLR